MFCFGCSSKPSVEISPLAQKGRTSYVANCIACHHPSDPSKPGSIGPEITGSSRELLRARLVDATYPPGYKPKRTTTQMPKLPHLAGDIDALVEFLKAK